ncbi:MAG: DUF3592 domain-containing protein [Planctomycetota bacterium]
MTALFAWLLWPSTGTTLGQRIMLWLLCPFMVFMVGGAAVGGVFMLRRSTQHVRLTVEGLHESRWLISTRFVPWEDVLGASLDAHHSFGMPPSTLLLHRRSGRDLKFDHGIEDWPELIASLRRLCPVLSDLEADRVVESPHRQPPRLMAVRANEPLAMRLAIFLGITGFAVFIALGVFGAGLSQWRHWQLQSSPDVQTTTATVLDIEQRDKSTHARIEFVTPDGQTIRKRRRVPERFSDEVGVGGSVSVRYLPDNPKVAEIKGYDLAGRSWILFVIAMPFAGLMLLALPGQFSSLVGPVRRITAWRAVEDPETPIHHIIALGETPPQRTVHAFPDRHRGPATLLRFKSGQDDTSGLEFLQKTLDKHGVPSRMIAKSQLLLGGSSAEKLWGRIGKRAAGDDKLNYACLDMPEDTPEDDAEAWLKERLEDGGGIEREALAELRFYSAAGAVGPFSKDQLTGAFNRWVATLVAEAWHGRPPAELAGVEWASRLALRPEQIEERGGVLLIERTRYELNVWFREADSPTADLTTWSEHGWSKLDQLRPPRSLRDGRGLLGCLVLLMLSPLLMITLPIQWAMMTPFEWYERRRRRTEVRRAQSQAEHTSRGDSPVTKHFEETGDGDVD